jgi:GNAT superfamily N-acetyltransferase
VTLELRTLQEQEVPLVQPMAMRAFDDLAMRSGRPPRPWDPVIAAAYRGVHQHLRHTDPGGSLLALRDGEPVGAAVSYRRGPLWVLSLLVVEPGKQSGRAGSALLDAVLHGAPELRLLHASSDARAMRLYSRAGFRLLPSLTASGTPVLAGAPQLVPVAPAGVLAADLAHVLATGGAVLGLPGDAGGEAGRAVVVGPPGRTRVLVLDPADATVGADLLRGALALQEGPVEVGPLAPQEHWATEVALEARLELAPRGPVAVAGMPEPLGGVALPAAVYV